MLAEKRIHTKSVPNVETDRLMARLDHQRVHVVEQMRACENREGVRAIVRELVNVERELMRRAVMFVPVTNGAHLRIDVHEVREVRPMTRGERGDFR